MLALRVDTLIALSGLRPPRVLPACPWRIHSGARARVVVLVVVLVVVFVVVLVVAAVFILYS